MMEAARTSETLVNFYQTTWRYNPEDTHLYFFGCFYVKSDLRKSNLARQINVNDGKYRIL
jgi:hypothetical protein